MTVKKRKDGTVTKIGESADFEEVQQMVKEYLWEREKNGDQQSLPGTGG